MKRRRGVHGDVQAGGLHAAEYAIADQRMGVQVAAMQTNQWMGRIWAMREALKD